MKLNGDTVTGDLTISARVTADKWANTQSALSYAGTTTIDMDGLGARTLSITGNVTFATSNRLAGRMVKVKILVDGQRPDTDLARLDSDRDAPDHAQGRQDIHPFP